MFDDKIGKLLEMSRFSTCQIKRNFLPRRIGLGYDFRHENVEIEMIKEIKRKHNKNKRTKIINADSSEEECFSKSKMVK